MELIIKSIIFSKLEKTLLSDVSWIQETLNIISNYSILRCFYRQANK